MLLSCMYCACASMQWSACQTVQDKLDMTQSYFVKSSACLLAGAVLTSTGDKART